MKNITKMKKIILLAMIGIIFMPSVSLAQSQAELEDRLEKAIRELEAQVAEIMARQKRESNLAENCLDLTSDLRYRQSDFTRNGKIAQLQNFLKREGDYVYPEATGFFGKITVEAVSRFQRRMGISPDVAYGVVGENTREKIEDISCDEVASIRINPEYLTSGRINLSYFETINISNSGSRGVWNWNIENGRLPRGLSLNSYGLNRQNAVVIGRPTRAGVYEFDLTLSNPYHGKFTRRYQLIINDSDGMLFGL